MFHGQVVGTDGGSGGEKVGVDTNHDVLMTGEGA